MNLTVYGWHGKPNDEIPKSASIRQAAGCLIKKNQTILLAMKLTFVLLTLVFLQVSARGVGQSVTFAGKDVPVKTVFEAIKAQTGYVFFYDANLLKQSRPVTINVKNKPLTTLLDEVFSNQPLGWTMVNKTITIYAKAMPAATAAIIAEVNKPAPFVIIKGRVTGDNGQPLNGATVLVKGGNTGVQTDAAGNFTVDAAPDAVLIISYVGYETMEIAVANRTNITIQLKAVVALNEQIVVVGYATQRKRDLTGSITSIKGDEISRQPNTNPIGSLQGKVAGLTVTNTGRAGASPTVRIRGINSTNSASPVYVVDGILHDNIDFLNPSDIESIDILRDPSSIAIYGLRGANGVIAVTSKKAARGTTRINLQSTVGVQKVISKIDVTDAAGFRKLFQAQERNQNVLPADTFDFRNYTANTDWQDQIFRNAIINSNNLSISNSGEKSSTYLNLGYSNQEGVLKYDKYERFLLRLNEEIRFNSKLRVGGDFTGYHWIDNPPAAGLTNALWASPIVPIQQDANTYYSMPSFQRAQVGNPVATLNRNNRNSVNKGYRVIGSLFAEIKFLQKFTWKSTLYGDFAFNNGRSFSPLPYTFIYLGENTVPTSTFYDNSIRTSVSQDQSESKRLQQDHTLTYDTKLGQGHSLNLLGGFTTIYSRSSFINGTRRDTSVNVPDDPNFWYLSAININNPGAFGGGGGESSIVGAFGRASYSYKGKYLLNATVRRDGSSKFAPENRWGTFGSVGAGWVVSDEKFFSEIKNIDFVKLRAAWGKTGNANGIADNLYKPGISNASTAIFGENVYTSIQASYIPDPNLHWEVVNGYDLGIDVRALKNKLNAEITYYNRTTTDILTALTIPNESRSYFTNLGKITNKGIELSLGWSDNFTKDLSYNVSGNFSYNKNVVNSIGDNINFQLIGNSGANLTVTGNSIGHFYGYRQVGVYQSTADLAKMPAFTNSLPGDIAYEDINGDGVITSADRTYLGSPFPPYSFGLNISLAYKGFDFAAEGQGVSGNKIYTQRRTANFATLNYESNRLNAWTAPGTNNVEPIMDNSRGNNYLFSSYYLEPGDYFRIRTLQLGYTFSQAMLTKAGIQKARIFVSGQNIKSWSQVTGYSPEAQIGNILGGGADNGVYPVPAVYSVGLNLTF